MPTPRVVRVVAQGELSDWPEPGPAAHLKVFLPDTPVGPVMRTYTVRDWDRERGAVTLDFSLNEGAGPATQWASRVVAGMRLEIAGRSRSTFTPRDGGRYLFAGDETALPAITTCVAALPPSATATVILEVADAAEQQPLVSNAGLEVYWLYHGAASESRFAETVVRMVKAEAPTDVWIACEAQLMRIVRRTLLDGGLPAAQLSTRGYWKRGESDHPDHDTGEGA